MGPVRVLARRAAPLPVFFGPVRDPGGSRNHVARQRRPATPLHRLGRHAAGRWSWAWSATNARRPTSCPTSRCRSSSSSPPTAACRPRTWSRASSPSLERALTRCDHLEHIESRSLLGIGIIKVYFRPRSIPTSPPARSSSLVNGEMQNLPPGMLPPSILKYDATAIPVGNLVISSDEPRRQVPARPGRPRAPRRAGRHRGPGRRRRSSAASSARCRSTSTRARWKRCSMSPMDVARIVNKQSQVIPTGEIRIGKQNYYVSSNSHGRRRRRTSRRSRSCERWPQDRLPAATWPTSWTARAGAPTPCRVDGRRAVYMPLLRQAGASAVRRRRQRPGLPAGAARARRRPRRRGGRSRLRPVAVRPRRPGQPALRGARAAPSWRRWSCCCSWAACAAPGSSPCPFRCRCWPRFVGLYFTGHTLNIMTLGGLALVLGRVVDDSIVDVENTVRHLEHGQDAAARRPATAPREIAVPGADGHGHHGDRLLPADVHGRRRQVPVHAAGGQRRAGHVRLVHRVADRLAAVLLAFPEAARTATQRLFPRWLFAVAAGRGGWSGWPAWAAAPAVRRSSRLPARRAGRPAAFRRRVWPPASGGGAGALAIGVGLLFWISPRASIAGYERFTAAVRSGRCVLSALRSAGDRPGRWCVLRADRAGCFRTSGRNCSPRSIPASSPSTCGPPAGRASRRPSGRSPAIEQTRSREVVPRRKTCDLMLPTSACRRAGRRSTRRTTARTPPSFACSCAAASTAGARRPATTLHRLRGQLTAAFPGNDFFFETGGMIRRILNSGAVAPDRGAGLRP